MKYLKLTAILVAVLAIIIGAMFITSEEWHDDIYISTDSEMNKCRQEFEQNWKKAKEVWNEKTYKDNIILINSYCDVYSFSTEDSISLTDYNSSLAFNYVHRDIFAEWGKTNCNSKTIDKLYKATNTIAQNKHFAIGNEEIQKIRDCKKIYDTVKNLTCDEIHAIFNKQNDSWTWIGNNKTWNTFADYETQMKNKLKNQQDKYLYKTYLANACENDAEKFLQDINSTKTKAFDSLATQIIAAYPIPDTSKSSVWNNIPYYTEEKEKLESLEIRYHNIYNGTNTDLKSHVQKYRNCEIFKISINYE